jgi:co-chaperonin GroES (HSP10)
MSQTIATGQDSCEYMSPGNANLTVIVYQPNSGVTWQTITMVLSSGGGTVKAVSGVGDKAMAGSIELDIQTGDKIIAIQGAGGTLTGDDSKAVAVGKALVAAL